MKIKNKTAIIPTALYSMKDVCELFGVSRWSIYPLVKNRILIPAKVGRSYSFLGQHILDFVSKKQEAQLH